jgi:hypothetical protein
MAAIRHSISAINPLTRDCDLVFFNPEKPDEKAFSRAERRSQQSTTGSFIIRDSASLDQRNLPAVGESLSFSAEFA